jgi:hypothetical protein
MLFTPNINIEIELTYHPVVLLYTMPYFISAPIRQITMTTFPLGTGRASYSPRWKTDSAVVSWNPYTLSVIFLDKEGPSLLQMINQ